QVLPHYRFDLAEVIVSIGADFMGTWPGSLEYAQQWSKNRKLRSEDPHSTLSKMVCFEPVFTITGASADERYPLRPGDEHKIALAHEIIVAQKRSQYAGDSAVASALAEYTPERVAADIGLEGGAARIQKLAHELWAAQGRGLVVAGGIASRTPAALGLQVAV